MYFEIIGTLREIEGHRGGRLDSRASAAPQALWRAAMA